jgi:hypothetical protein
MKKLLALGTTLVALFAGQTAHAQAILGPNVMQAGVLLTSGNYIESLNHNYRLVMQADGNLVLYAQQPGGAHATGFSTGTGGSYAVQQNDANFVVYTASNTWKWTSQTGGHASANYLMVLGEDGSLTIREPVLYNAVRQFNQDTGSGGRVAMNFPARRYSGSTCIDFVVTAINGFGAGNIAAQQGGALGSCANQAYLK